MVIASDPPSPPHVAIFAFPFSSHVSPLLALTSALAAAAPAAIFSFVSTAGSLPAFPQFAENIHFFPVDDGFPDGGSTASLEETVGMFLAAAPGNLRAASERASAAVGVPLSCVVSDWFMCMVSSMAEEIGVPWVALIAGYPTSLLAHLHTDDLRRRFGIEEQGHGKALGIDRWAVSGQHAKFQANQTCLTFAQSRRTSKFSTNCSISASARNPS